MRSRFLVALENIPPSFLQDHEVKLTTGKYFELDSEENKGLTPSQLAEIFQTDNLIYLNLNCTIERGFADLLARILRSYQGNLQFLNLSTCNLENEEIAAILESIAANSKLFQQLQLIKFKTFTFNLINLAEIPKTFLNEYQITFKEGKYFKLVIKGEGEAKGFDSSLRSLFNIEGLIYLELSCTQKGFTQQLLPVLKQSETSLQALNLADCKLDEAAISSILQTTGSNSKLFIQLQLIRFNSKNTEKFPAAITPSRELALFNAVMEPFDLNFRNPELDEEIQWQSASLLCTVAENCGFSEKFPLDVQLSQIYSTIYDVARQNPILLLKMNLGLTVEIFRSKARVFYREEKMPLPMTSNLIYIAASFKEDLMEGKKEMAQLDAQISSLLSHYGALTTMILPTNTHMLTLIENAARANPVLGDSKIAETLANGYFNFKSPLAGKLERTEARLTNALSAQRRLSHQLDSATAQKWCILAFCLAYTKGLFSSDSMVANIMSAIFFYFAFMKLYQMLPSMNPPAGSPLLFQSPTPPLENNTAHTVTPRLNPAN